MPNFQHRQPIYAMPRKPVDILQSIPQSDVQKITNSFAAHEWSLCIGTNRMIFPYSVAAIPSLFHNTPDSPQPPWCKESLCCKSRSDSVCQAVPWSFISSWCGLKCVNHWLFVVRVLFLDFHFFPAAMHLAIAAAGYDKFCATHRTDIPFSYLICHIFRYLLCYCDESIIFLLKP